eukprot:240164-Karenia_brevis.AAC.1
MMIGPNVSKGPNWPIGTIREPELNPLESSRAGVHEQRPNKSFTNRLASFMLLLIKQPTLCWQEPQP